MTQRVGTALMILLLLIISWYSTARLLLTYLLPLLFLNEKSTSTMRLPTIVLVPGGLHTPSHYLTLANLLRTKAYTVTIVSLPSIGESPGAGGLADDIAAVRAGIYSATSSGNDVILVMHSMGAISGCAAVEGYVKGGKPGGGYENTHGVVGIVAIAGILLQRGETSIQFMRARPRLGRWTHQVVC